MKGVAIIGSKGGTGKTSISHALALGAAWHNIDAIMCHTDDREPLNIKERPYLYYDARDPKKLSAIIEIARKKEGIFIVDGGGNRPTFDKWLASIMDLIIITITPDQEGIKQAINDYNSMKKSGAKNIYYLVNKYPANKFERVFIEKYFNDIPENDILCKVPELKSIRLLREDDIGGFKTPPTKINNLSRLIYKKVNNNL